MASLDHRQRSNEWMDRPDIAPVELRGALQYIRRINRLLGYARATVSHFERFSQTWKPGQRITVLDVGTGSADIPTALLAWARSRGFDVTIVGVDLHAMTVAEAGRVAATSAGRLKIVRADALRLPFVDGAFDYAMNNMFIHHLDEPQIVACFQEMDRVARRGVVVADLLRTRRAHFWIRLFSSLSHPMIRHDAVASVKQALSRAEAVSLAVRGGLDYTAFYRHFGHRYVLAGEKVRQLPVG